MKHLSAGPVRADSPTRAATAPDRIVGLIFFVCTLATAQTLSLPPRPTNAPSATELLQRLASLDLAYREEVIATQFLAGNVPPFLRKLCPLLLTNVFAGKTNVASCYVTPDYLALGSDEDYFLTPISPHIAQGLADKLGCTLPTPKLVDAIYAAAEVKLAPSPIPPSPAMTNISVFSNHNMVVRSQRAEQFNAHPLGALVAGHKKDVVICSNLANAPGKVAIYGWHRTNGEPIQPLYLGHTATWVDYSQCTRLVQQKMVVNGESMNMKDVIGDPRLAALVSEEGIIPNPRYPIRSNALVTLSPSSVNREATNAPSSLEAFERSENFQERISWFRLEKEVRVHINAPAQESFSTNTNVLLVFYALPNGNTIEQTVGKILQPGDDWHYDIQHIGAQTRFLRELPPDYTIVVAYLENDLKSWPAWKKKYGTDSIPQMLATIKRIFTGYPVEVVLSGHSGGGSWIFGYINSVDKIPADIVRITFLDSNYAYDRELGHKDKLLKWLQSSPSHYLCVLAYNDAVALLNGKTFVSAAGGTWGRSQAMRKDFAEELEFKSETAADLEKLSALDGRVQFLLKENPEKKILHTVQVERNGFIHCLVSGTTNEGNGYQYFGPRAYSNSIR